MSAAIEFRDVSRVYGEVRAVDRVSLTVQAGEFFAMLGPSGSGKTTCLRLIAGFETPDSGSMLLDGRDVTDEPPYARAVNTVFQDYALFPHMSVLENVAYGPRVRGQRKEAWRKRALEMLELVQLGAYAERRPAQLSGGQRQRVGLARAMAADPPLMLMDEPFGAIDPITRERLQNDFLRLHREVRKTVIFVTHDIDEAIKMGDRICILRQGGKLAQYDTPEAILANPADEFVADFVGADRGLKRLGLRTLGEIDALEPTPRNGNRVPGAGPDMSLRDALSLMLTEGSSELEVHGDDGGVRGYLTLEAVSRMLGEGRDEAVR
jgi:osmoprotectant transport system ATP-binding protein